MGEALVRVGVRWIPVGIAAVVWGFVLKSPGTQAGSAEIGLRAERPRISVFGTIHPDIFRLRAPLGSQPPVDRVRLASLGSQIGSSDAAANEQDILVDTPVSAWPNASASRVRADCTSRLSTAAHSSGLSGRSRCAKRGTGLLSHAQFKSIEDRAVDEALCRTFRQEPAMRTRLATEAKRSALSAL